MTSPKTIHFTHLSEYILCRSSAHSFLQLLLKIDLYLSHSWQTNIKIFFISSIYWTMSIRFNLSEGNLCRQLRRNRRRELVLYKWMGLHKCWYQLVRLAFEIYAVWPLRKRDRYEINRSVIVLKKEKDMPYCHATINQRHSAVKYNIVNFVCY